MKFSQHLRSIAEPIWAAQLTHPFVVGLGNGTLPERKFKYYILQDALFLADLAQAFGIAAEKAPDAATASDASGAGSGHERLFSTLISPRMSSTSAWVTCPRRL